MVTLLLRVGSVSFHSCSKERSVQVLSRAAADISLLIICPLKICKAHQVLLPYVVQKLHHPHTVQFLGAVTLKRPFMIVTEFIAGGSLANLLDNCHNKPGPSCIGVKRALEIAQDVCRGMTYLHRSAMGLHHDAQSHILLDDICALQCFWPSHGCCMSSGWAMFMKRSTKTAFRAAGVAMARLRGGGGGGGWWWGRAAQARP